MGPQVYLVPQGSDTCWLGLMCQIQETWTLGCMYVDVVSVRPISDRCVRPLSVSLDLCIQNRQHLAYNLRLRVYNVDANALLITYIDYQQDKKEI